LISYRANNTASTQQVTSHFLFSISGPGLQQQMVHIKLAASQSAGMMAQTPRLLREATACVRSFS
jgi:hypothetical protein